MPTSHQRQPTNEPWPEGVFARYLTVGRASVDLAKFGDGILVECTGCPNWSTMSYYDPTDVEASRAHALEAATRQGQEHAERCRAMPKPDRLESSPAEDERG